MSMKPNQFQCYMCGEIYNKGWTEEEALAELKQNWGDIDTTDCEQVCDDCFGIVDPSLSQNKEKYGEALDELSR